MVFDRVPASISPAWMKPLGYLSLAILALTFLAWPISWAIRRRYKASLNLSGRSLTAYRATRIAAGLVIGMVIGWGTMITAMFANLRNLSGVLDPYLVILQLLGIVVFIGSVVVAGWNLWLAQRDGRKWTSKLWAVLVLLSTLIVLYIAFSYNLMSISTKY